MRPDHSNPPRPFPALFTGPTPELLPDPISRGPTPRTAVAAPFYLAPDRSPEWAGWAQPAWTPPSSFQRALTLHRVSLLRFPNDHKLNCKSRALPSSSGLCRGMAHNQGQEGSICGHRAPRLAQAQRPLCPQGEISCAGAGVGGRKNKEVGGARPRVLVQSPWGHGRHTASQRGHLQQGG